MQKTNATAMYSLPPSPRQEAALSQNWTIREIALKAIQWVGILLIAAGVGCFIASLQIPAISLVVAGAIALILGFTLKEATPITPLPRLDEQVDEQEIAKIKTFIASSKENLKEPDHNSTFFNINGKPFLYTNSQNGLVIQACLDWSEGTRSGIYLSNETNDLKINPNEKAFIYQYLTALSAAQIQDLLGDMSMGNLINVYSGAFRNSSSAFSNFHKALIEYSNTSNLDELIDATNASGQGSRVQPNTVRETFRAAFDLNQHGGIQQTLKVIQKDPHTSRQKRDLPTKEIADSIQRVLPIIELILQRAEG